MGAPSSSVEGMTSRRPLAPLSSLRLLVIDDHPLFRAGLRHLVNELADQMEVVEFIYKVGEPGFYGSFSIFYYLLPRSRARTHRHHSRLLAQLIRVV